MSMSHKTFTFESSSSSNVWTVKLAADGSIWCDCPSWRFLRPGKPRGCKHCDAVLLTQGKAKPRKRMAKAVSAKPASHSHTHASFIEMMKKVVNG